MRKKTKLTLMVTVECVGCKKRKKIDPASIPKYGTPVCECYLPMIIIDAAVAHSSR